MALITLSGFPSSGKTRRAQQLKAFFDACLSDPTYAGPALSVAVLSDDALSTPRSAYDDSRAEKPARAALLTAVQRQLGQNTVLILDGMNYIKGWRYQLYCAARELKLRTCTVHVVATPEQCREWNASRGDGQDYALETLDNLIMRYEEPSSMVRWDAPLFTVLWSDDDVPGEDMWKAITQGIVKPPNAGTQAVAKAPSDALRSLENATTAMVSGILAAQSASGGAFGGPTSLSPTPGGPSVRIDLPPRNITIAELQRLKRAFVTIHKKATTLGTTEKGVVDWGEESVAAKFAVYLEENLKP